MRFIKSFRLPQGSAYCLALAVGAVVFTSQSSPGQYRLDNNDGRRLDANNRLGSSGYNTGSETTLDSRYGGATGNQIVTGNVTGFKYFRGRVGYTDPGAFRGNTAGRNTDAFIRDSAGTGDLYRGTGYGASAPRAFYGDSYAAPPPAGFQQTNIGTGAYVAGPRALRTGSDLRLGRVFDNPLIDAPKPGDLILPGPVDNSTGRSLISASPLYGVRQWDAGGNDPYFLSRVNNVPRTNLLDKPPADDAAIRKMQDELRGTLVNSGVVTSGADANAGAAPGALPSNQLSPAAPGTSSDALPGSALNDQLATPGLDNTIGQDQTNRQQLIGPAQQSTQYAELENRFKTMGSSAPATDAEAARQFQEQVRAKKQADAAAAQKDAAAGKKPPLPKPADQNLSKKGQPEKDQPDLGPAASDRVAKIDTPGTAKPAPLQVKSLATGVKGRGLAEVMTGAEALLKQGKFSAALDQYDIAEQVAPNNPLIRLGRSNAELGAGFYARAEQHLREAFTKDSALLVGQYDLKGMLGEDRINFLVNDLKDIANSEQDQVRPVFLLAYLSYNTSNERRASAYLDLADKRSGGKDALLGLLRHYWSLPTDGGKDVPTDMNK